MLDDLRLIHERDAQDALGIAEKQWQQLVYDFKLTSPDFEAGAIDNIVFAGMGGSALGALLSQSWPAYKMPFEIVRGYDLPGYISNRTLFFASSYSGNTEETLEALSHAETAGAKIIVITGGGRLLEIAQAKNYPLSLLPSAIEPRYATLYSFKALVSWLKIIGLVVPEQIDGLLEQTASFIKTSVASWRPDVATAQNYAKQLALDVVGKSVVVYAGPLLFPAAYKWKISFNENAKNIAWCNQYPEFNHNEFIGWTSHPLDKSYAVIELRSKLEHPRIQRRFVVSERLLSGRRPALLAIEVLGENLLEQLMWAVSLGDFVTLYTAILNGLNPTPVELIEKFKKELG